MDQIKIGKFIAQLRKEKNLTQRELAEKLLISDKTISKWECGNGFPEISLVMPLCEVLGITVNELLSAQKLTSSEYQQKAEENIIELMNKRKENVKKIIIASITVFLSLISCVAIAVIAGYIDINPFIRGMLIAAAVLCLLVGVGVACVLDKDAGTFECKHCKENFVPSMKAYIWGMHTITTRYLKCPKCGKKSWCKKRLGDSEEDVTEK